MTECNLCYNDFEINDMFLCSKYHMFCRDCLIKLYDENNIIFIYNCIYCKKQTNLYQIKYINQNKYKQIINKKNKWYTKIYNFFNNIFD
jgi:hypothetical protein